METAISKLTQDFSKLGGKLSDWLDGGGGVGRSEGHLRQVCRLWDCLYQVMVVVLSVPSYTAKQ